MFGTLQQPLPQSSFDTKSIRLKSRLTLRSHFGSLRSLNGRLKPYGFEYKSGKIIQIGQESGEASTASSSAGDVEASAPAATETNKPKAATKTPKTSKAAKTAKAASTKKTPASKKRKVEETVEEEEDNAVEADVDASAKDEGKGSDVEE